MHVRKYLSYNNGSRLRSAVSPDSLSSLDLDTRDSYERPESRVTQTPEAEPQTAERQTRREAHGRGPRSRSWRSRIGSACLRPSLGSLFPLFVASAPRPRRARAKASPAASADTWADVSSCSNRPQTSNAQMVHNTASRLTRMQLPGRGTPCTRHAWRSSRAARPGQFARRGSCCYSQLSFLLAVLDDFAPIFDSPFSDRTVSEDCCAPLPVKEGSPTPDVEEGFRYQ